MQFHSPLRYPGGKNKLAKFVALICRKNNVNGHYVEPYAGGASVAFYLLFNHYVREVTINDIDRSIYAFWWCVLNRTDEFCDLINNTEVNIENWKKYREIQKNKQTGSLLELGFSTFFLNRTNISGIIDGGVIGGIQQDGKYKIDCRFNKLALVERIKKIAELKGKIHLYNLDALVLIKVVQENSSDKNTIFYFDPPYYLRGSSLYMNYYDHKDHKSVSDEIKKMSNVQWIVSYDNVPQIKKLYRKLKRINYSFFHTAYKPRYGREVLFFSNNLSVPKISNPVKI